MLEQNVLTAARELRKAGRLEESVRVVRHALRRRRLAPEDVEKAGRFLDKHWIAQRDANDVSRVLLLGQCTTTWLGTCLTAVAAGQGTALRVGDGSYDNVLQQLTAAASSGLKTDVVVLLPWHQRLLGGDAQRPAGQRVDDELAYWQQGWKVVEQLGARLIQIGYDWVSPGPLSHQLSAASDGPVGLVRQVNQALYSRLPKGAYFVDLEQVSGAMGRDRFYDPRRYFWTKQPFSEQGSVRLAEQVWAGMRALVTGPKKVLVLDLDNTLWGGVVGETGPLGVELGDSPAGEAYRAFQKHVKELGRRGCVLAVSSKNNPEDAREPFAKNPDMVLSLDDFAAFEASWDPKAVAIKRMAKTLQLGLDSFVFFDDNPVEREHVRQALPEVEVVEVPEEPAEYVRALQAGLWFETVEITAEDRQRVAQYRVERQRREAESSFGSMDDYLASLGMAGDFRPIDEADFVRVVQLIGKTNQFNLTTRRHSAETLRKLLADPATIGLTLRASDRFGDYGLIAVLLLVPEPGLSRPTARIDLWLMSCRVIGRTVEEFFFNAVLDCARARGFEQLLGEYIPTAKNTLVQNLYDRLGFTRSSEAPGSSVFYTLDLERAAPAKTFVAPVVVGS